MDREQQKKQVAKLIYAKHPFINNFMTGEKEAWEVSKPYLELASQIDKIYHLEPKTCPEPSCVKGRIIKPDGHFEDCPTCNGIGTVPFQRGLNDTLAIIEQRKCPECKGTGEITEYVRTFQSDTSHTIPQVKIKCKTCKGTGKQSVNNQE